MFRFSEEVSLELQPRIASCLCAPIIVCRGDSGGIHMPSRKDVVIHWRNGYAGTRNLFLPLNKQRSGHGDECLQTTKTKRTH